MKKGIILYVLCIALCFPSSVFASSSNGIRVAVDGDVSPQEGGKVYIPTLEDMRLERQKFSVSNGLSLKRAVIYKTLDVPTCKQIYDYYCGPATVQQTIKFLNGVADSQDIYAAELGTSRKGTTMPNIADVLNNHTNKSYVYSSIGDYSNWCSMIIKDLTIDNMPPVIDIDTSNVSEWPYVTTGHFLNISGYQNNPYVKVRVTDPFEKGLGNHWYSGPVVYKANNDHWRKAMIW